MEISVYIIVIILSLIALIRSKKYNFKKQLKKCESPIEEKLIKKLYEDGFKPYSQYPCGKYRIDIAITYKGKKVAIECDGKQFHSSKEQKEKDMIKDSVLNRNKWRVYRFTGSEIYKDVDGCVKKIRNSF